MNVWRLGCDGGLRGRSWNLFAFLATTRRHRRVDRHVALRRSRPTLPRARTARWCRVVAGVLIGRSAPEGGRCVGRRCLSGHFGSKNIKAPLRAWSLVVFRLTSASGGRAMSLYLSSINVEGLVEHCQHIACAPTPWAHRDHIVDHAHADATYCHRRRRRSHPGALRRADARCRAE